MATDEHSAHRRPSVDLPDIRVDPQQEPSQSSAPESRTPANKDDSHVIHEHDTFYGLTSAWANRELIQTLRQTVQRHFKTHPFNTQQQIVNLWKGRRMQLTTAVWMLYLISVVVSPDHNSVAAFVLVSVAVSAGVACSLWVVWQRHTELGRIMLSRLEGLTDHRNGLSLRGLPLSSETISVLRDNVWASAPVNTLVKNDSVRLAVGKPVPCKMICVEHSLGRTRGNRRSVEVLLEAGDLVPPPRRTLSKPTTPRSSRNKMRYAKSKPAMTAKAHTHNLRSMTANTYDTKAKIRELRVAEIPAEKQLRDVLEQPWKRPTTVLSSQIHIVDEWLTALALKALVVGFVITITRVSVTGTWSSATLGRELFGHLASLVLPIVILSEPVWLFVVHSLGNAFLFHRLETHLEHSKSSKPSKDIADISAFTPSPVKVSQLLRLFRTMACGRFKFPIHMVHPFQELGQITVFCCPDNEGILSKNEPSPEHLLFVEGESEAKPVVVDLIPDSDHDSGFTFEGEWREHLPSIKPIGLNCLLNTNCNIPRRQSRIRKADFPSTLSTTEAANTPPSRPIAEPWDAESMYWHSVQSRSTACLCLFGKEIGFHINLIRERYVVTKRLHTVAIQELHAVRSLYERGGTNSHITSEDDRERILRQRRANVLAMQGDTSGLLNMTAVSVQDTSAPEFLQLLSSGDPLLVLDQCREFWDGSARNIYHLGFMQRQRIYEIFQHWTHQDLNCVAFGYTPIPQKHNPLFLNQQSANKSVYLFEGLKHKTRNLRCKYPDESPELEEKKSEPALEPIPLDDSIADNSATETEPEDAEDSSSSSSDSLFDDAAVPSASKVRPLTMRDESFYADAEEHTKDPEALAKEEQDQFYRRIQRRQIFLGMVAMRTQAKVETASVVEKLNQAGVRFVYFSPHGERKSRAFGHQIGLDDTDWNGFISLRDRANEKKRVQGMSKLPLGVSAIRQHIIDVDNVPLLVPLFIECDPHTIPEMIRIYQQYGENVLCLGSSLQPNNTEAFMQANISIALDPLPYRQCIYKMQNKPELSPFDYYSSLEFNVSRSLTSLACTMHLPYSANLYHLTDLVSEARRLLSNTRQCLLFYLACQLSVFLLMVLQVVVDAPPLLEGYHIFWLEWVVFPTLSLALLQSPTDDAHMMSIAGKNEALLSDWRRYLGYFGIRFGSSALVYFCIFLWMLHDTVDNSFLSDHFYYGTSEDTVGSCAWTTQLVAAQSFALFTFVFILSCQAFGFVHRTLGATSLNPLRNTWLTRAFFIVNILQLAFSLTAAEAVNGLTLSQYSWWIIIAVLCWPVVTLFLDSKAKAHDAFKYKKQQQFARLNFDTKLGMHSPK